MKQRTLFLLAPALLALFLGCGGDPAPLCEFGPSPLDSGCRLPMAAPCVNSLDCRDGLDCLWDNPLSAGPHCRAGCGMGESCGPSTCEASACSCITPISGGVGGYGPVCLPPRCDTPADCPTTAHVCVDYLCVEEP